MELTSILRQFPPQDTGFTFKYQGQTYNKPYETLMLDGHEIQGLRENKVRLPLLDSIITEYTSHRDSYLDIGSNLGTVPNHFRKSFREVFGVEGDGHYMNLAKQIYPGLGIMHMNLNQVRLTHVIRRKFDVITALSMIEYIIGKKEFVQDLYDLTQYVCIVEGHSEDIHRGTDKEYEALLKTQPWTVIRRPELTDPGINAPSHSVGRPLWVMVK